MCINSMLYRICACIFNSHRICVQVLCSSLLTCMGFHACMFNSYKICAQILYSDLLDYFLDERSTRDAEGFTRKCDLLRSNIGDDSDLP